MNHPNIGLSTKKDSTFKILGRGTVILKTLINGVSTTITLNNILHTLSLRSNLILVSKLSQKGAIITFIKDEVIIQDREQNEVIRASHLGQLYPLNVYKSTSTVFTTQSKRKPIDFGTWHHRLEYTRANIIHEMAS